jgi:spore maturation protein CgeB
VPGLRASFGDAVATYADGDDLRARVDRLLADPEAAATAARHGRALVLAGHTFGHRVDALLATVAALAAPAVPLAA